MTRRDYLTSTGPAGTSGRPRTLHRPATTLDAFRSDPAYLVRAWCRFDLPLLGDVAGLRGVHLQCHIGTDTISLARLGARMTGLDFSPAALEQARRSASETGAEVDFVEADVYDAAEVLPAGAFDLVFTGIGALCWLPSVTRWAEVVARLLGPAAGCSSARATPCCGRSPTRCPRAGSSSTCPYFEREEPLVWDEGGTYVETDVEFQHNVTHEWNHGLGEIVSAVLDEGLVAHRPGRARQHPVGRVPRPHRQAARRGVPDQRPPVAAPAQLHVDRRPSPANARTPDAQSEADQDRPADRLERCGRSSGGTRRRLGPRSSQGSRSTARCRPGAGQQRRGGEQRLVGGTNCG